MNMCLISVHTLIHIHAQLKPYSAHIWDLNWFCQPLGSDWWLENNRVARDPKWCPKNTEVLYILESTQTGSDKHVRTSLLMAFQCVPSQIAKTKLMSATEVEHMLESVWRSSNVTSVLMLGRSPISVCLAWHWQLDVGHSLPPTSPLHCPHAIVCIFKALQIWI